jgi:hypothetical protein
MGTPVSSTNKTDCHDITDILLKVALNTIKQTNNQTCIKRSLLGQRKSGLLRQVKRGSIHMKFSMTG